MAYRLGDCTVELLFGGDESGGGVFFVGKKVVLAVVGYPRVFLEGGRGIR